MRGGFYVFCTITLYCTCTLYSSILLYSMYICPSIPQTPSQPCTILHCDCACLLSVLSLFTLYSVLSSLSLCPIPSPSPIPASMCDYERVKQRTRRNGEYLAGMLIPSRSPLQPQSLPSIQNQNIKSPSLLTSTSPSRHINAESHSPLPSY